MKVLTFFLLFFTLPAFAGGPGWSVKVKSVELNGNEAIIKLENQDEIYTIFQACKPLTISASYQGEHWFQLTKTWSKHTSKEKHANAIEYLQKAHKNNTKIMFGYIGTGILSKSKRNICNVISRALVISGNGVVSFHDPT